MLRFTSWWSPVALIASLVTCLSGSSTLEGYYRQRLHAFVISEDTNATTLTYSNTGADYEQIVATFQNSLPPSSLCGAGYDRCNVLVTSNSDESIQVVLFPLESGIGLVSFDYSSLNDSLVYRDQFLLSQSIPDCTFLFFVEELIGYCLQYEPAKIHALQIRINYTNLNASMIHRRVDTFEIESLISIANLSNFVYFVRRRFDGCFTNERNHVIFLDQGELFDHSFMDGRFLFPSIHVDSSCSKLYRVGDECGLATHCKGRVVRFDTREHIEQRSFPEVEYGQIFFCRSGDFVRFEHETLDLHDKDHQPFGNRVPFPFGKIRGGHCVNVDDDKFFFIATIDDGSTILVNFSDTTYQHLGISDLSRVVSARVNGDVFIINNGSATEVYSLGLACAPQPLVLHKNNFILATFFTSETRDRYWCLDHNPAPVEVTTVTTPIFHMTPLSDPANNQTENSSQGIVVGAVVGGTVSAAVLLVLVFVVVVLVILGCTCKRHILAWYNKRKQRSPAHLQLGEVNPESPLPCPVKSDIELGLNKDGDVDQKSSSAVESFESQETLEPLLNSRPITSTEDHGHHKTSTGISESKGDGQPSTGAMCISDLYVPRLDCIEDVPAPPPTTVHQNPRSLLRDSNYAITGTDDLHRSISELTPAAGKEELHGPPVACTESPRRQASYSYHGNSIPTQFPRVGASVHVLEEGYSGHPSSTTTSTVTYQENHAHPQSPELRVEGHSDLPCSTVSEVSSTAAAVVLPIQEAQNNYCNHGCMVGVQAHSPNFDRHDVKKVYSGLDSKMNEQEQREYVESIVNGDSQSQNSEPNNDLPLDRQGSNDSQENEN